MFFHNQTSGRKCITVLSLMAWLENTMMKSLKAAKKNVIWVLVDPISSNRIGKTLTLSCLAVLQKRL
jgi:hypothetical protein